MRTFWVRSSFAFLGLGLLVLIALAISSDLRERARWWLALGRIAISVNLDEESVPTYVLPDALALTSSEIVSSPADWVEIRVVDTGVGISAELREQIFEPFFTTRAEGSGLGLAMVHRIVDSHGGSLQLESEIDRGTSFRIRLPRASVSI